MRVLRPGACSPAREAARAMVTAPGLPACPCTRQATTTVEWECRARHPGRAVLCKDHAAVHVAALMSDGIMCAACRREGSERAVMLLRVNGKRVNARLGRIPL